MLMRKAVGLGVAVAAIGLAVSPTPAGLRLEDDIAFRWLFFIRGPTEPPDGVAVVSIDKTSADQLGLKTEEWPPPRHVHADVIRSLSRRGAAAIMLDVFFRSGRTQAEDDDLADAIAGSGRTTLFERVDRLKFAGGEIVQTRSPIAQLRDRALATAPFPLPEGALVTFFWPFFDATNGEVPTLPAVALQIRALPYLDPLVSILGRAGAGDLADLPSRPATPAEFRQLMTVLRRVMAGRPGFSATVLALIASSTDEGLTADGRHVLSALVKLYGDRDSRYLNFYGPPGRIRTIPFHQLLTAHGNPPDDLEGTVVFVGEAAPLLPSADQRDTYHTVYSNDGLDLSGAEIAATAFANLLTDNSLRRVPLRVDLSILIAFGILAAYLARGVPGLFGAGSVVALGAVYAGLAQYLFSQHDVILPLGVPLLVQLPVALVSATLLRYRDLRKQVIAEIEPGAVPDLVHCVCASTDIENYTAASASMEPGALAALMNEYYASLSTLVSRRNGVLVGRAGDSAMCVWTGSRPGSRLARVLRRGPAHAQRLLTSRHRYAELRARASACRTALEISRPLGRSNVRPSTPLRTRIGVHAGEVALGPVGGEYHVVGDVPNVASRIQGLNKRLGTSILASESAVRGVQGFCLRPVGRFVLAGRPGDVAVVEILGLLAEVDPATLELCERFGAALACYEAGDLQQAAALFAAIASDHPADGPTRYYRDRCADTAPEGRSGRTPSVLPDALH